MHTSLNKIKAYGAVIPQAMPTCAIKNEEERLVWLNLKKMMKMCVFVKHKSGHVINTIACGV
jgi:hypothetical protein